MKNLGGLGTLFVGIGCSDCDLLRFFVDDSFRLRRPTEKRGTA